MTPLRQLEALLLHPTESSAERSRRLRFALAFGATAFAAVTATGIALDLDSGPAALAYLLAVLLLSLADSLVLSILFSVLALTCLDFFFTQPRYSFQVDYGRDLTTMVVFMVTALVVAGLVRQLGALAAVHREQARLLDLTHDSVFVRDADAVITFWNRASEQIYGWTAEEAIGRTTHDLLKTQFPAPFADIERELRATGRWEGELIHSARDGRPMTVASRWSLQKQPADEGWAILETNNDITERRRAEAELQRVQAAYLAEAQRISATGSFSWILDSDSITWSDEAFRIFGYEPGGAVTLGMVLDRVHPDDRAMVAEHVALARARQEMDFEHRLLLPDASVRHLHIVAHALGDSSAQLVGAIKDVTADKLAQEQLNRAQAEIAYISRVTMLGELTASIAHEVNQPVTAIVTSAEACVRFLRMDPPMTGEAMAFLARIVIDGRRAGEIVHGIRALARKTDPQLEMLDLNEIALEAASLARGEANAQHATIRLELTDTPLPVRGDRVQFQQVILNLAINSAQAMAAVEGPRELVIRSVATTGKALLSVEDTGPGIAPEARAKLFDAFFTTKPAGMGMGLSVCRNIVEAHGGECWADDGAGPGATFHVSLPLAAAA